MKMIRQHKAFELVWWLMIALFINSSVDPVDPDGNSAPEKLSINEMESILEIIAEQILEIDDCFAEHDEDDNEGSPPLKPIKDLSKFDPPQILTAKAELNAASNLSKPQYVKLFNSQFIGEVNSPPPEAV